MIPTQKTNDGAVEEGRRNRKAKILLLLGACALLASAIGVGMMKRGKGGQGAEQPDKETLARFGVSDGEEFMLHGGVTTARVAVSKIVAGVNEEISKTALLVVIFDYANTSKMPVNLWYSEVRIKDSHGRLFTGERLETGDTEKWGANCIDNLGPGLSTSARVAFKVPAEIVNERLELGFAVSKNEVIKFQRKLEIGQQQLPLAWEISTEPAVVRAVFRAARIK